MSREEIASSVQPSSAQNVVAVLLVNGDDGETETYRHCLEAPAAGYAVAICDFPDVLDRAGASAPDVIVTDLVLSRAAGGVLELIRSLRQNDRTREVAIIVITARTAPSDYDAAFEAGCDMFLPKPCYPEVLLAEVRRGAALTSRRRFGRTMSPQQSPQAAANLSVPCLSRTTCTTASSMFMD
jgi:DNA-binding response OmpR family regulator